MTLKPRAALFATASLLAACETYTEKTSPCFGRNGEPQITRAALSFSAMGNPEQTAAKDCTFEPLPSPA